MHLLIIVLLKLLGRVVEVGSKVTKFKVGDTCAVGCFIDACLDCVNCKRGDEQYCVKGMTGTYNGDKKHGRVGGNQTTKTAGGYSAANTVIRQFYDHVLITVTIYVFNYSFGTHSGS